MVLVKYKGIKLCKKNRGDQMRVTESEENYLEAILMLKLKKDEVKAVDIARKLDFSKPSVSYAMRNLTDKGLITIEDNNIELTKTGLSIAQEIYERHNVIAEILIHMGVDKETAYEDSCEIEHKLSQESFDHIKEYFSEVVKYDK